MRLLRATAPGLWLLLAACSEGPSSPPPPRPPAPKALARLTTVQGQVSLERAPAAARPADIEDLFANDLLSTTTGARAVLRFPDGSELELAENGRYRLTADAKQAAVDLKVGIISLLEGAGEVTLLTAYGRTRLKANSKTRMGQDDAGVTLDLLVGEITQLDDEGKEVSAKAGQRLRLTVGDIDLIEEQAGPTPDAPRAPLPAAWTPVQGAGELRPKGSAKFKPAGKARRELEAGTAFKLPGAAKARLETAGVRLALGPGSTGAFEGAGQVGARRELQLSLSSGLAELTFEGDGPAGLVVPVGGALATVQSEGRALVRTRSSATEQQLAVVTGEVDISVGGGAPTKVRAGEVAVVGKAGVKVSAARRPALVLPLSERRVRVYSGALPEVGLAVGAEEAEVQVSTDPAFKELLFAGKAQGQVSAQPPGGTLYWRTLDTQGQPAKRGQATFLRERGVGGEEKATDEVAESGSLKATVVFQEVLPSLTFKVAESEKAVKYQLRVFKVVGTALQKPAFLETTSATNRIVVESGKLPEGNYVWQAVPVDANGNEKVDRPMNKMEISYDNSNLSLSIRSPANNQKATAETVASGVAPVGTKLYLNGAPVTLDPKGRFEVKVGRTSPLVFRSVGDKGDDYWIRVTR